LDSLGLKVLQKYQKFLSHRVNLKVEESKMNGGTVAPPEDTDFGIGYGDT
jgi:hypothetical protein